MEELPYNKLEKVAIAVGSIITAVGISLGNIGYRLTGDIGDFNNGFVVVSYGLVPVALSILNHIKREKNNYTE